MLNFLGRYRIALSRVFTLALSLLMIFCQPMLYGTSVYNVMFALGLVLVMLGIMGRVFASIYMSDNRHVKIVTQGVYSITRNPLYMFSFIGTIGICLVYGSVFVLIIVILAYLGYYKMVINYEEIRLTEKFGSDYTNYLNSGTPRFFPNFKLWQSPDYISVKPSVVLRTMWDSSWFLWVALAIRFMLFLQQDGVIPTSSLF